MLCLYIAQIAAQIRRKGAVYNFPTLGMLNYQYRFFFLHYDGFIGNSTMLTFDDGPHGHITPLILDVLKNKGAKATFYVIGLKAELHPDIIRRMHAEGHDVASHGWEHPLLTSLSHTAIVASMNRTNDVLRNITGTFPVTMRPPWGKINVGISQLMKTAVSLEPVMWSLDSRDWTRPDPNAMVEDVLGRLRGGDVILCHDIHPGTLEALPQIIEGVQSRGFKLMTLSFALQEARRVWG